MACSHFYKESSYNHTETSDHCYEDFLLLGMSNVVLLESCVETLSAGGRRCFKSAYKKRIRPLGVTEHKE